MNIKAVVFDLDGTLVDTAPDFIVVLNQLLAEEGCAPLPDQRIRDTVSNGARALISLGFDLDEQDPEFERLRLRLLDLYSGHLAVFSKTFAGIDELLSTLKQHNLLWGIATNKPEIYTTPLLQGLGLTPDCVICPDHVAERKPHPESLHLAAQQLGITPENIIYVGDHIRDIECGRRAGSVTIAAYYGYIDEGDDPAQWQATYNVNSATEIWPIVKKHIVI